VLQIANVFAGYSLGEADILRRAIGKKKKSILDKEKQNFIKGAAAKGYTKKDAEKIWGFIDKFAGYGFNKAHSASYAMIAYQTAYMKVNYPVEYMAALLTTESNSHSATKDEKITQAIDECQRMGIKVMPPDINRSAHGFTIEPHPDSFQQKAIRFGLSAIKNVGTAAVDAILEVRDKGFGSVTDFFVKVDARRVNKKVVECLIRSGAFDQFAHRGALIAGLDGLRETAQSLVQSGKDGQDGLFDAVKTGPTLSIPADKFPKVPDLDPQEKLADEKRLLGVYLSDHPLKQLSQALKDHTNATIAEILESTTQETKRIGGLLVAVRKVMTKTSNAEMAFATLEDQSGSIDLVIFPKTFDKIKQHLIPELPVVVSGKIDTRSDKRSFIVNSIELLSKSSTPSHDTRFLNLTIPRGTDPTVLKKIGAVLKKAPGDHQAIIYIENGDKPKTLTLPYTVNADESLKQQLLEILPGLKIELPKST
jgi:DNA polymerase III subunit alpha